MEKILINSDLDVPKFLWNSIHVVNDTIYFVSVDGIKSCPVGSTIGYKKSTKTNTGYACWKE